MGKKKILAILIAVMMVFTLAPMSAGQALAAEPADTTDEELAVITVLNECGDDAGVLVQDRGGVDVTQVAPGSDIIITFTGGQQLDPDDPNYNEGGNGGNADGRPAYLVITQNSDGTELFNELIGHNEQNVIKVPAGGITIRIYYADPEPLSFVVTPDTFPDYFDVENNVAILKEEIADSELTFSGDFSEVLSESVDRIVVDRTVNITGDEASFENVCFEIAANDVSLDGLSINNTATQYTVYAENVQNLSLSNNQITFKGNTDGSDVNNALFLSGSEHVSILNNTFDITLVSADVKWDYSSSIPVSEGLVFDNCHDLAVSDNKITVGYEGVYGSYDTILGIDIKGNDSPGVASGEADVLLSNNTISLGGHSYAYGLQVSVNDYQISDNTIQVSSDEYYATAIDIENGTAVGVILDNEILAKTTGNGVMAFGIYGSVYSPAEIGDLTIGNNTIDLQSAVAFGIQIAGSVSEGNTLSIHGNTIRGEGDSLAGIALNGSGEFNIFANSIYTSGANQNQYSIWDQFYSVWKTSYGIGVLDVEGCHVLVNENTITSSDAGIFSRSASEITNNVINAGGDYTIDVFVENKAEGKAALISDNTLNAKELTGDSSVRATEVDTVQDNKADTAKIGTPTDLAWHDTGDGYANPTWKGVDGATEYYVVLYKDGEEWGTCCIPVNGSPDTAGTDWEDTFYIRDWMERHGGGHYSFSVTAAAATESGKLWSDPAEITSEFYLIPVEIEPVKVTVPQAKTGLAYNGKAQTGVAAGENYTVSGGSGTNAKTYTATLSLKDKENYIWADGTTADKKVTWKIAAKKITPKVTLSATAYNWNGKVKNPTVTVKDGNTKLAASQYTVTYAFGRKNVGAYKVTVKMKGNYSGSKAVTFKINPKATTLKTPAAASKAITVKWTKQATKMSSARITGYQIQLATDSKFTKNKKTVTVSGYGKVSRKVTGLRSGKKYYVRIRTYKKITSGASKGTYYSPWSKAKTVTTK